MPGDPRCEWLSAETAKYRALSVRVTERILVEVCRRHGVEIALCEGDYAFLSTLMRATEEDLSMAEIARTLGINPSSATRRARRLEQCGFISRQADYLDDRRFLLEMTPAGAAFMDDVEERMLEACRKMYAEVTEEELRSVYSFTEKCIKGLQRLLKEG